MDGWPAGLLVLMLALCRVGGAPDPVAMLLDKVLLFLSGGFHGQDGLSVFVLHHLQGDLCIPALVLRAPKINLPALCHDHGEVDVFAFPLHTIHRLHVGEVQLLDPGGLWRRALGCLLQLFWGDEEKTLLGEQAPLLLPQLQQAIAPLLQKSFFYHLTAALQHPPPITRRCAYRAMGRLEHGDPM